MGFGEVLWEGSSLLKGMREKAISSGRAEGLAQGIEEGKQQGIAEGKAEGLTEGQAVEARRLLRTVLADRFPGLEAMPEIDRIAQVSTLESLLIDRVLKLSDRGSVEQAIREASQS